MGRRPKRLRNKDFPNPKRVSDDYWLSICATGQIAITDRQRLRGRIDDLVDAVATWMRNERIRPDTKSDRERVKEALSRIQVAMATIKRLGPIGRAELKAISPFLAPMLAAQWMSARFPDDDWAPRKSTVPADTSGLRPPLREPIRGQEYFIEEYSLEARLHFVSHAPVQTTIAILKDIEKGLTNVVRGFNFRPRARGGQNPLQFRHDLLINLIEMWSEIGKPVSSGPNSPCVSFCEFVADAIGWPTGGLSSAMPDAVKHWRHLSGKISQ